ncbi:hypothetical protein RBU61_14205 [Tissierella sp. MB52-C2]|uniref:hypothetical protein n=1 Tax=Tissierella sp. MB52-C2 TaxID=3070999 RepID=UPI00280B88EF|nr:hypothetical protein [Tissierella sp. MB52-C2]WMM24068.1 hypothetical protein RBU61_14205 [Tissierella sp. MB52-C2]
MTQQEVKEMINDSIRKLRDYNAIAESRIDNLTYRKDDIEKGRQLLLEIQRGELFEDGSGRNTEYELLVGEEEFRGLRKELRKTNNLVSLLKGEISLKVYRQKDNRINSSL